LKFGGGLLQIPDAAVLCAYAGNLAFSGTEGVAFGGFLIFFSGISSYI